MAKKPTSIVEWVERCLREDEPKSKSLIISVFGDSIAPRSNGIWLSDLITLLEPFGISERLVRTSSFRLIEEEWLETRRDGRRSYYSLTPSGLRRLESAYSRVYTPPQEDWDGNWTLVMLPRNGEPASDRGDLRRELEWEGFGSPTLGVMVHPSANPVGLRRILEERDMSARVAVLRARALVDFSPGASNEVITQCWDLEDVRARYTAFIDRFEPLLPKLSRSNLTPDQAFLVQTLLIHAFRRASLHDPRLPISLLPAGWPGLRAYKLCRDTYIQTYRKTSVYLQALSTEKNKRGGSQKSEMLIKGRFGGIP